MSVRGPGRQMYMSTFVLIPGAGSTSWYWHLVTPLLEARGHDTVAVDLPFGDESADFGEYTRRTVEAVGDRRELVVVGHSLGAFTATLVCAEVPVDLLVLVAAMVPRPGESAGDWWANTGHESPQPFDEEEVFLHDVPADIVAAGWDHVGEQAGRPFEDPWPLTGWPDVPTRFLLCRDDRFFTAEFQRRVVRERLGIEPDEMNGGHLPSLAHPAELADRLLQYADDLDACRDEWRISTPSGT